MAVAKCCSGNSRSITPYCITRDLISVFALVWGLYPVSDFFKSRWLAMLDFTPPLLHHYSPSAPQLQGLCLFSGEQMCLCLPPSMLPGLLLFPRLLLFPHCVSCRSAFCGRETALCRSLSLSLYSWDRQNTWRADFIYALLKTDSKLLEQSDMCVRLNKPGFKCCH